MQIIKRDGRVKNFQLERIQTAIKKAYLEVYNNDLEKYEEDYIIIEPMIMNDLANENKEVFDIEEVQDVIVNALNKINKDVSKAYQEYRENRNFERGKKSSLDKEIVKIINADSEETTSNGNVDGSKIQSIRALIANVACRDYSQRHYIPRRLLKKHKKSIYNHDEQYFGLPFFNCCLVDWIDMFKRGFRLGATEIETPNSLTTAGNILSQVASHISSNTYGGTTFGSLIEGLTPYGRRSLNKYRQIAIDENVPDKEGYSWRRFKKEAEDFAQSLEYEVQTLVTSRGETPFLTLGINKINNDTDEETQKIQKILTEAILNQRLKGLTGGVTPVFPKLVYQLERGNNLNKEDKYYELFKLATRCSAFRQYPDYTMTDKVIEVTGNYKEPMGCRSFLGKYIDENGNEKIHGRFNWGVTSINLVRLAIQSKGNEVKFYKLLDEALDDCKELIMIRYKILKKVKAKQSPILYMSGAIARLNAEDTIEPLLNNGYSSVSIGYVGLHNCLVALCGEGLEKQNPNLIQKGAEIMQYIRDYCDTQKKNTGIGFSMYGSPAETLATKFCVEDVKDFGIIKGVNDKGYYENSFHYPSNELISPFEKLDLESNLSKISSGGAISFIELGDMTKNLEAMEDIIRYAYDKTHFLGISSISDKCLKCGYVGEIFTKQNSDKEFECPVCKNDDRLLLSIIRKLCGYLGSIFERPTADGKMKEIKNRVDHKGCS
jgi:anaerobic ribonucleoside-triphosphate reductase